MSLNKDKYMQLVKFKAYYVFKKVYDNTKVIKNGEKNNKWSTEHEIHNFSYKFMFLFTVKFLLIKIGLSTCYM